MVLRLLLPLSGSSYKTVGHFRTDVRVMFTALVTASLSYVDFPDLWMMMAFFGKRTKHLCDWGTPVKPSWADQNSETCPGSLQRLQKHVYVWKRLKIWNGLDMQYIRGLFATPAKTRLRLKTAENTKWSQYAIYQRALCNAWKYVSVTTENTLRTIHTQYMNKQICTTNILEQQVSSPQQLHHIHFINMSLYS